MKEEAIGWIKSFAVAIILVVVVRTFLFSPVLVDGASMEPTLHDRERIIMSKAVSWIGEPDRGDIVIISSPEDKEHYVKRVIAVPGDEIEMDNDVLIVNGKEVKEPYLEENRKQAAKRGMKLTEDFGPIKIPDGEYFVMGDNRYRSRDSRNALGFIQEDRIIGKSKFVIFPFGEIRTIR